MELCNTRSASLSDTFVKAFATDRLVAMFLTAQISCPVVRYFQIPLKTYRLKTIDALRSCY